MRHDDKRAASRLIKTFDALENRKIWEENGVVFICVEIKADLVGRNTVEIGNHDRSKLKNIRTTN